MTLHLQDFYVAHECVNGHLPYFFNRICYVYLKGMFFLCRDAILVDNNLLLYKCQNLLSKKASVKYFILKTLDDLKECS